MAERTGLTEDEARAGTGAVLATLRETISDDDYRHLIGQLPAGYSALAEPAGDEPAGRRNRPAGGTGRSLPRHAPVIKINPHVVVRSGCYHSHF